ncbi:MAG: DUF5110 domain-containing protein [Sedimentisphaerales bacterium]|nr:DUF5110 domain-containing protein [Sedimentisphaerales bacterium]
MSKYMISLLLSFALFSNGFGKIIYKESFTDSKVGNGGTVQYSAESLDYNYHVETGGSVVLTDCGDGISFDVSEIGLEKYQTYYLSFCLKSLNQQNGDKYAGLFLYNDDKEMLGMGNAHSSDNYSFWGSDGKGKAISDVRRVVDGQVHKVVLKVEVNADGPENISVGLDPFCRRSESRQPDHIWTSYSAELTFDEIRIRSGNKDCSWAFDELVVADSWSDICPGDNNPGEYIDEMTKNAKAAQVGCYIGDNVVRFLPEGVTDSEVVPSVAFLKQYKQTGDMVAGNWELKPQYGIAQGKKYAYIALPEEYDLYGTGEVTGSLLRNGYKILLQNKDNAYWTDHHLYQSHPWVMGLRPDGSAFGVIFDSTWIAELDLSCGIMFTVDEDAPYFPVVVFEGKDPQQVAEKLGELVGNIPMPPRWALGFQQCRHSYYPDSRAREIADNFRARQIPCDVIWFDIYYMDGFRVFSFSPQHYPDPTATNDYLHKLGFKSVWMIDPGVKDEPGYFVYDSGSELDVWVKKADGSNYTGRVWPGQCVFPDFTCPEVRTWWAGQYKDFMATGIDGVWNDMNEPAVFDAPHSTMYWDNQHRGGGLLPAGSHRQYHNIYGMMMVKGSREGIQAANPDKRPFVLTRSNYLGGHRYAATWTGDNYATWDHLKLTVPMVLTLGLSGQSFSGPDIGGFIYDATPDMFGHWIALGAFYPFSRAHATDGSANQEPWEFGPAIEDVSRIALQRRYRLMPYLYTAFQQSHTTGLPIMRPRFYGGPGNIDLRMEDQAFMVGDDMIVIPKWAQNVKLPAGMWQSFSLVGEDSVSDKYQCDMLIRGGAIIPLGPVVQSTAQIPTEQQLTLLISLDNEGKAQGNVYEDAGDGYEFQSGQYRNMIFTAEKTGNKVIVKCAGQQGQLKQENRLVTIDLLHNGKTYHTFGNICSDEGLVIHIPE